MKLATIIKIVLLVGVMVIGLLIFFFWWGFYRTQATNISEQDHYAEIVGKELIAEQESFIASYYEHFVKENSYRLQMNDRFFEGSGKVYSLPVGTKFKIKDAKSFYNAVSGFSSNMVLGSVFIKELNKEVEFEFYWGEKQLAHLSDESKNYFLFDLAPWQKEALPYKYFPDGKKEPFSWPARIRAYDFAKSANKFVRRDTFQINRNFDNYYEKEEDWGPEKQYFGYNSELDEDDVKHLKLAEIYPDYTPNSDLYTFHNDYQIEISKDFISLVVTLFKGEHEMESHLINYDLDGNILGNLKISYDEIAEGISKRESVFDGNTIIVNDIVSFDTETSSTMSFHIQDSGKIAAIQK